MVWHRLQYSQTKGDMCLLIPWQRSARVCIDKHRERKVIRSRDYRTSVDLELPSRPLKKPPEDSFFSGPLRKALTFCRTMSKCDAAQ